MGREKEREEKDRGGKRRRGFELITTRGKTTV